jgi:capsular polysaccharide transport system ATP-binding protein
MIVLRAVSKSLGQARARRTILDDVDAVFHLDRHYVVLGQRGAGKSTLLRILCGIQRPSRGRVQRSGSVSLPAGAAASLAGTKTGRQLAAFLAHLYEADAAEVTRFAAAFSRLEEAMDLPVMALSPSQRTRLGYALTYAVPVDFYLFDEAVGYGDAEFRRSCLQAFEKRREDAATIVATSDKRSATRVGDSGALLHAGQLHLFDTVAEAIDVFQKIELSEKVAGLAYAETLIRNGEPGRAREHLKQHLSEHDDTVAAYELLADLSLRAGHLPDAVEASQAVLDRMPQSASAHFVFARVAERQGDFRKAAAGAAKALEIAPAHREAQVLLARCYESLGMHAQAASAWRNLAGPHADPLSLRLAIRNDMKAANWAGVLATVDLVLDSNPNDPGLLEIRVRALLELQRWQEAGEAVGQLAGIDFERALRALYHLVKTPHWRALPALLIGLPRACLGDGRSTRTMNLILTFLERQATLASKESHATEAEELLLAVAMIDPARKRQAVPSDPIEAPASPAAMPDLSTAASIARELLALGEGPADQTTEVRRAAVWAAGSTLLAARHGFRPDQTGHG